MRSERFGWLAAAALLLLAPSGGASALEIFACEPEWAALARELAPRARVTSAVHERQDPHHIEARPALISALRRADLAICTGASLEAGWLPTLQQRAGNRAVQDGRPGMFYAAGAVTLVDPRARGDRSRGDVHEEGNPHFHLDPERLKAVARELAARLGAITPPDAAVYRERQQRWEAQWNERIGALKARAAPLAGRALVAQHTTFAYLWQWLGVRQIADLEPVPGLPPTVGHLQEVLARVREESPIAVVQSLYQDPQAGRWLAGRIGVPVLVLPSTVMREGRASEFGGLFELLVDELLAVAGDAAPRAWTDGKGFYPWFAILVSLSVPLLGLYLVLTTLIVPALLGLAQPRLGWIGALGLGSLAYALGLLGSLWLDLPGGPCVVVALVACAALATLLPGCGRSAPRS